MAPSGFEPFLAAWIDSTHRPMTGIITATPPMIRGVWVTTGSRQFIKINRVCSGLERQVDWIVIAQKLAHSLIINLNLMPPLNHPAMTS